MRGATPERFSGDASGAGRRNVPTFVRGDANAIAGSNFMFFDLSTGELTGLFVLDGDRKHGVTGKNIDVISLNGNGAVVFHDENSAYSQSSSLIGVTVVPGSARNARNGPSMMS